MYLDGRSRLRFGTAGNRLSRWLAILFPVTAVGTVFGQSMLAPPPGFQGAPAVPATGNVTPTTGQGRGQVSSQTIDQINSQANGTAEANGPGTSATAEGNTAKEAPTETLAAPLDAMARWGAVHIHPRVSYQFLYANGVHSSPGQAQDTITHTIAPGVTLNLGPHVTVDYSPSIRFFSEKQFHNTVDHALEAHAGYGYGDWTFGISQNLAITDQPTIETSGQVEQTDYHAGLFASYHLSEKASLSTSVGAGLLYTSGGTNVFVGSSNAAPSSLTDSQSYNAAETFDYNFNEHLSGGVMVSVGYTEQSSGFRSVEEQGSAHLAWHPGTKLSATLSGGVERRSFLDSKSSDAWNPIYSANLGYQLFEQTALSVYANRSVNASIFDRQLSENTTVGVGIQQRLFGKVHLSLGMGYNKADYKSTATTDLSTSRSDESLSYTAGASVGFLKRFNFSIFYEYSQNQSSQSGFSYDSNQLGVSLAWAY
jgi:hypothetical protein